MTRTANALTLIALFILPMFAGCSSLIEVNERRVSVEDVLKMSEAGVGADVIIRQIEVTHSRYELTPDQIIRLKRAGVEDSVVECMVETESRPSYHDERYGNDPYEYGYRDYGAWYPVTPYPYTYYRPYVTYRETGLIGRFYRYGPAHRPPYRLHDRRYEWRSDGRSRIEDNIERRDKQQEREEQ